MTVELNFNFNLFLCYQRKLQTGFVLVTAWLKVIFFPFYSTELQQPISVEMLSEADSGE